MDARQKQLTTNKILTTIKAFEAMFPEEFGQCDIKRCGYCGAKALADKHNMFSLCNKCHGIGYTGHTIIFTDYICRKCQGMGCEACKNLGTIDWIEHARGADIKEWRVI